jgi:cytochrome b561
MRHVWIFPPQFAHLFLSVLILIIYIPALKINNAQTNSPTHLFYTLPQHSQHSNNATKQKNANLWPTKQNVATNTTMTSTSSHNFSVFISDHGYCCMFVSLP